MWLPLYHEKVYICRMNDKEILERIRKGDETALQYLYRSNYRTILRFVLRNNGTESEAQDIFQDALVALWENVRKKEFILSSKLSTYLYSVCQNMWLKELKKKKKITSKDTVIPEDDLTTEIQNWEREERIKIIQSCIDQLGETCKKILQYFYFDELPMQEIAERLGFANADSVKSQKYKCKKELDKIVKRYYTTKDLFD